MNKLIVKINRFKELKQLVLPTKTDHGIECHSEEIVRLCPSSGEIEIGPGPGIDIPGISNYEWFPKDGLSDTFIKNPKISYNSVPSSDFQLMRYNLIYTNPQVLTENLKHCVIVYKWKTCAPPEDDNTLENPIGN